MGTTVNEFVNSAIAQLRKDDPEALKRKPQPNVQYGRPQKVCPECGMPRGTEHVNCNYTGRAVRE